MDDYCYDEDAPKGNFSFEHIGRLEAVKTAEALTQIDELLVDRVTPEIKEPVIEEEESPFGYYRRMESTGYDAHCERVDQKEIASWQSVFPYFLSKGEKMKIIGSSTSSGGGAEEDSYFTANQCPENSGPTAKFITSDNMSVNSRSLDLSIEGKKIVIPKIRQSSEDYSHGILEEVIALNVHPSTADTGKDSEEHSELLSPHSSKREEVISLLLDAVLPEVVDVLRPLVLRVVQVSREIDLKYDRNEKTLDPDNGDRMSVEDGYESW